MNYVERYGKWALVLGGSEGLGRAMACELAKRGMNLALAARREGPLRESAAMIARDYRVETKWFTIDLAQDGLVEAIEAGMGGEEVSFLVYNAAAEPFGEFLALDLDAHLFNIQVNITAPTRIVHHFGRAMVGRERGALVLCSSLAAFQGLYAWVGYSAAKAYEALLGEGLWVELADKGVDAATFMIGSTWTEGMQRTQKVLGGPFAESRDVETDAMARPQLPEEAAANFFAQADTRWLPVIYANPADKVSAEGMMAMERDALVTLSCKAQRGIYKVETHINR